MTDMPTNSLCDLEKLLLFTVKKKRKKEQMNTDFI